MPQIYKTLFNLWKRFHSNLATTSEWLQTAAGDLWSHPARAEEQCVPQFMPRSHRLFKWVGELHLDPAFTHGTHSSPHLLPLCRQTPHQFLGQAKHCPVPRAGFYFSGTCLSTIRLSVSCERKKATFALVTMFSYHQHSARHTGAQLLLTVGLISCGTCEATVKHINS